MKRVISLTWDPFPQQYVSSWECWLQEFCSDIRHQMYQDKTRDIKDSRLNFPSCPSEFDFPVLTGTPNLPLTTQSTSACNCSEGSSVLQNRYRPHPPVNIYFFPAKILDPDLGSDRSCTG